MCICNGNNDGNCTNLREVKMCYLYSIRVLFICLVFGPYYHAIALVLYKLIKIT